MYILVCTTADIYNPHNKRIDHAQVGERTVDYIFQAGILLSCSFPRSRVSEDVSLNA